MRDNLDLVVNFNFAKLQKEEEVRVRIISKVINKIVISTNQDLRERIRIVVSVNEAKDYSMVNNVTVNNFRVCNY